ncbi:c-type cytochrome [Hwanghaeella sp.]|uniref:c-type cytochrome n=1 Tax=Hwanghaeella sp. TaxID=2605943 RepID=UPI003CCB7B90
MFPWRIAKEWVNVRFKSIALVLILIAAGSAAHAHSTATCVVKDRMDAMVSIGKATKSIVAMMRGKQGYDPERLTAAANRILLHGGESLLEKFPEGSLDPPSEALPEIWEDWVTFKTLVEEMRREALLLKTVAPNGSEGFGETVSYSDDPAQPAGPVATRLVKTCKNCHEQFRQEE